MRIVPSIRVITVLSLAVPLAACTAPAGPPPHDRVRAVVLPYLTHMPFHIAAAEGYFADEQLDVEFLSLGRNQDIMASLTQGDVDVAAGMLTVNELNLAAAGARLRIVAALATLEPDACTFTAFLTRRAVLESGALSDPDRLVELRMDVSPVLPFAFLLDVALRTTGVATGDLQLVDVPPPAAVDALRAGTIDVTGESEPFVSLHLASDDVVVWHEAQSLVPGFINSVVMYGPTLLDERPDVGRRFMVAMLRAAEQFRAGKTARNLEIVEAASGLTEAQVASACWPAVPADASIDPGRFREFQTWAVDRGLSLQVVDDDQLFDDRFVRAARRGSGR